MMMIARIREWCRSESLGIVVPVGFISLWVVWELLTVAVGSFIYPILIEPMEDDRFTGNEDFGFKFTLLGVDFQPDAFIINGLTALILGFLFYVLFWRQSPEDFIEEEPTRECPECLSEILAEARRCAFCTAQVAPVTRGGASDDG
jgi:hypothetical protein